MTSYAPTPMYQIAEGYANAAAKNMQNQQNLYDMHAQREADSALPQILMGLAGGSTNSPNTPSPGQPSMPSQPPQMPPMGAPAPQPPVPPPSPTGMPPPGGAMPGLNDFGANTLQNAASPSGGPNVTRMPPMPPQQPQQSPGGQQGGYDLPTLIGTIKQQYPNISGAALRNMITTLNPIILSPAAKAQQQMLKDMITMRGQDVRADTQTRGQDLRYGTGNSDSSYIQDMAQMYGKYGPQALAGLPPGTRMAVEKAAMGQGVTPDSLQQNLATNKGQMSAEVTSGHQVGALATAQNEFNKNAGPAIQASNAVPRSTWLAIGASQNWLKQQTNDPNLKAFQAYNEELINTWARSVGGGKARQSDIARGEEILSRASSPETYQRGVETLQRINDANLKAGQEVINGKTTGTSSPSSSGGDDFSHLWQ